MVRDEPVLPAEASSEVSLPEAEESAEEEALSADSAMVSLTVLGVTVVTTVSGSRDWIKPGSW